jgi:hypothetical protein
MMCWFVLSHTNATTSKPHVERDSFNEGRTMDEVPPLRQRRFSQPGLLLLLSKFGLQKDVQADSLNHTGFNTPLEAGACAGAGLEKVRPSTRAEDEQRATKSALPRSLPSPPRPSDATPATTDELAQREVVAKRRSADLAHRQKKAGDLEELHRGA